MAVRALLVGGLSLALPMTAEAQPATATALSADSVAGNYIWESGGVLAAVSTDGHQLIAYICNGNPQEDLTFAQWFHGAITGSHIVVTNTEGANLNLVMHPWVADGQVTLKNGQRYWFSAAPASYPGDPAELLRSEATFNGVEYLGGWVVPPTLGDGAPVGQGATSGTRAPLLEDDRCSVDCTGGAIIDVATGALTASPELTTTDLASSQIAVPNIGTFELNVCNEGLCRPKASKPKHHR